MTKDKTMSKKIKQAKAVPTGRELVEAYIRQHEGCTHTEITKAVKISTITVGSALSLLKRARVIESRGVLGQMTYHIIPPAADTNEPVFGLSPNMALLNRLLAEVRA
jgi:transcription initiation factor IIE alpha subunit